MKNIKPNAKNMLNLIVVSISLLLLVSNASALSYAQVKNNQSKQETTVSVDPNIHLTKTSLPWLKKSLPCIHNAQVQQLVQEIIAKLTEKNVVTSEDIKDILNMHSTGGIFYIGTGFFESTGAGVVSTIPGSLFTQLFGFYVGPVHVGFCEALNGTRTRLPYGIMFTEPCEIILIDFIGFIRVEDNWNPDFWVVNHHVIGFSALIIITG